MLADSHCHLDWFPDPEKVVERALEAGVEAILTNSTTFGSITANYGIAEKFPLVSFCAGLHPSDILGMAPEEIERGFELTRSLIGRCSAIGEVGIDFKHAPPEKRGFQEKIFRRFIAIAKEHEKPLVVHTRFAEKKCLQILEEERCEKVLLHWFTNSIEAASRAVDLGYFISCGPIIFSDAPSAKIVEKIPLESLLLETDAPVAFRGKKSEPSWIPRVCEKAAEIKGASFDEVSRATGKNYKSLFSTKL